MIGYENREFFFNLASIRVLKKKIVYLKKMYIFFFSVTISKSYFYTVLFYVLNNNSTLCIGNETRYETHSTIYVFSFPTFSQK